MAIAVYILCALTSLTCTYLLLSGYRRNRMPLLLWSGLCFVALGINNILLVIDLAVIDWFDFTVYRNLTGAIGAMLLVYGLLWKCKMPEKGVEI
jgi:hypothetical protein